MAGNLDTPMNDTLPPDVAAYLKQAALELAEEQKFQPDSEDDTKTWLANHSREIGTRAQAAMQKLANTLLNNPEMMDLVCREIGNRVYSSIPKPEGPPKFHDAYLAYCKFRGVSDPSKMFSIDGDSNSGYICWRNNPKEPTPPRTAKTTKACAVTVNFEQRVGHELTIFVPLGSTVSNKTAMGYDNNYRYWTDYKDSLIKQFGLEGYKALRHDMEHRGVNVPEEYCEPYPW